jgi:Domain of unknown function (DUF4174)
MKYFTLNLDFRLPCLCLVCMLFMTNIKAQNFDLKNYVWRKRVLLIFAVDAQNERFKLQVAALKAGKAGFEERDVVAINIFSQSGVDEKNKPINAEKVMTLRKKYAVSDNEFKVILIGKDGGAKKTTAQPFDNQQLFNLIDAMPMRKDEVKKGR